MKQVLDPEALSRWTVASRLLDEVLERSAADQRAVAAALGEQHGVTVELDALLAAAGSLSWLDGSLDELVDALPKRHLHKGALTGKQLDGWLLGEEIGRGGMSVVYLATRKGEGYEQTAALKILSIAFIGEEHVQSFLRERSILSELSHPGIARLIDGGVTPDGGPYLVMEYVDGTPIDQWCAQHQPGLRTLVNMVHSVARAAAHAQRHLVVHRDINPSNVLVDQRGRPVLIDFGIAKLLDDAPPGQTLKAFTPEFAAPEQSAGGAITTATDVYGLGLLLKHLAGGGIADEDLRLVVHAATHEDPEQRYANARNLADDLQAWLERRPVRARPESLAYRGRKFLLRHWQWAVAAVLVAVVGFGGLLATRHQAELGFQEAQRREAMADFMLGLFQQADLMRSGADLRVTDLLETAAARARKELANDPDVLAALLTLIATGQTELTRYDQSASLLDDVARILDAPGAAEGPRVDYLLQRGKLAYELGDFSQAAGWARQAVELLEARGGDREPYWSAAAQLITALVDAEQYEQADALAGRIYAEVSAGPANLALRTLVTHRRALALDTNGRFEEALAMYREALELQRQYQPENALGRAEILSDLGIGQYFAGLYADSEASTREVLDIYQAHFKPPHPRISSQLHNLAFALEGQERYDEAVVLMDESLAMTEHLHGPEHVDTLMGKATLGNLIGKAGNLELAQSTFSESMATLERVAPEMTMLRGTVQGYLGDSYVRAGQYQRALEQYLAANELYGDLPPDHFRAVDLRARIDETRRLLEAE